ncbi:MAG: alpha/beta fold hydrolase [Bacteroidales bacterium]|nr:alpha/beta fold hydrolase [Bacteroidales bacterium]
MKLHFKQMGAGEPLIILHGLYGSSDNWMNIGKMLSEFYRVYLVDQRNHGHSPHSNKHNYYLMRDDLLEFMKTQGLEQANIIGHSMGGKTALFFAVAYPKMVQKLIVVDIAPTPYQMLTDSNPHALNHLNIINALYNLDIDHISTLKEADRQLSELIPYQRIRQFLLKNLKRDKDGTFRWLLNVSTIRNELPAILNGLNPDKYQNTNKLFSFPVLFIKGEKSEYIQQKDKEDILKIFPHAGIQTIEGAGHWVHAEKKEKFMEMVRGFLSYNGASHNKTDRSVN